MSMPLGDSGLACTVALILPKKGEYCPCFCFCHGPHLSPPTLPSCLHHTFPKRPGPPFAPNDCWCLRVLIVSGDPSPLLHVTLHMHLSLQQGFRSLGGRNLNRVPQSWWDSQPSTAREPELKSCLVPNTKGWFGPRSQKRQPQGAELCPYQTEDEACTIFSPFPFSCVIRGSLGTSLCFS